MMGKYNPTSMLVPADFEVQQAAIDRQRAIADMLTKNSLTADHKGQMISGHYVAPSWLDSVGDVFQAYAGAKKSNELDDQASQLKDQYQTGLKGAVDDYLKTRNGYTKTTPLTEVTEDGSTGAPVQQQVAADPRTAIVNAMTSQYKPLQQLGSAELSSLGKSALTQKDILGLAGENKYDPNSVREAALTGDITKLKPARKEHVINGQLVQSGDTGPTATGDFRDKFGDPGMVGMVDGKPMLGQKNLSTGEAKFMPGGTTVNVDTGKKGADAFATTTNEAAAKNLVASAESAKKAQSSFEIYQNAKALLPQVTGGSGANFILGAKKIAQMLGSPIDDSVTSTEQVAAALGQGVLDNAKLLGSGNGFTDKDRDFLQGIVLGKISLEPKTLERAVNLGLAGTLNTMRGHEMQLTKAGQIQGADPAVLEQFAVPVPHFSLSGKDFDYSPETRRLSVKSSAGEGSGVGKKQTAPTTGNSGLTPAEQQELDALRKQFGRQ